VPEALAASFDRIVLDPPTFSNSKKMRDVLDVQRDHVLLINGCLRLLRPNGVLYFSTNMRRFKLSGGELAGAAEDISSRTIPPDFRNSRVHQCFVIRKGARRWPDVGP